MQKLVGLLAVVLLSFQGEAQETLVSRNEGRTESAFLVVKSGSDITKYQFSSIKDFEENTDALLDDLKPCAASTAKEKDCELTVEFSITVTSGTQSTTVSASITTCDPTVSIIKKCRTQLIAVGG